MKPRHNARKVLAVAALFALLTAGVPALSESLSASGVPACCNPIYCPLHHRQGREMQKDKSNCDSMGTPWQNGCSMRGCDTVPEPAMRAAAFVLVTPISLRGPAIAESATSLAPQFFPYVIAVPLTPPPRTFPS